MGGTDPGTGESSPGGVAGSAQSLDEMSLVELWLQVVKRRKLLLVVFLVTLVAGSMILTFVHEPRYPVTSVIDVGSVKGDGRFIPVTFYNTLVNKISAEMVPAIISNDDASSASPLNNIKVNLRRGTSLIRMESRVRADEIEPTRDLHKRLVDRVIADLENSYQLFNLKVRIDLLALRRQIVDLERENNTASSKDNEKLEPMRKSLDYYESMLDFSGPKVISVAQAADRPAGISLHMAYALVFFVSIIFSCVVVLVVIPFQNMGGRANSGG